MAPPGDWLGLLALIEEQKRRQEPLQTWSRGDTSIPALPPTMPATTPVAQLKNQTAMQQQYSPEAAGQLYNTPMKVFYGDYADNPEAAGPAPNSYIAGYYAQGAPVEINITGGQPAQQQNTLAHEFAHKWYRTQLPPEVKQAWTTEGPLTASMASQQAVDWRRNIGERADFASEMYAHNAETGPTSMPEPMREQYYPGLYRENITQPPQAQDSQQHFADLRANYFSPQQWVREYEAPRGYFASGQPVRSPLPFPAQWQPPEFPSMGGYANFIPQG